MPMTRTLAARCRRASPQAARPAGGGRACRLPDRDGLRPWRRCAVRSWRWRGSSRRRAGPSFNPLIVHLPDRCGGRGDGACSTPGRATLAAAFWPGPLTLVLPLRAEARAVAAGDGGPADRGGAGARRIPLAQALLRAFGGPVAAPSANPSGRVSARRGPRMCWTGWRAGSPRCWMAGPARWGWNRRSCGLDGPTRSCCAPAACRSRRWRRRWASRLPSAASAASRPRRASLPRITRPGRAVRLDATERRAGRGSGRLRPGHGRR